MSTGGAAMKPMMNAVIVVSSVGTIKHPNQPTNILFSREDIQENRGLDLPPRPTTGQAPKFFVDQSWFSCLVKKYPDMVDLLDPGLYSFPFSAVV